MKKITGVGVVSMMALVLVGKVSAHVTVQPKESVVGYTVSSVRVPNEKEVATTQVRVVVPEGVDVHGVMPVAGWNYQLTREKTATTNTSASSDDHEHEEEGRITEVTWTGGRIGVGEFMEFPLSVQYSAGIEQATWKAYQTYADGEIVPWDGSDDKHPAPTVAVSKESKVDALTKAVGTTPAVATSAQSSWLSVAAILMSVIALATSLKKKS